VALVGAYVAVLCAIVPILSVMIATASALWFLHPFYFVNFGAIWFWLRRLRREGWGEARLLYEDLPGVVTDLGIRDMTSAGSAALDRLADPPVWGGATAAAEPPQF